MSSNFKVTPLVEDQYLIEGDTPEQAVILNGTQYNQLKGNSKLEGSLKEFDEAVAKFYKPLTDATAKLEKQELAQKKDNPFIEVLEEGTPATQETPRRELVLSVHTVILKLIEDKKTDRLRWVKDIIVILDTP